MDKTKSQVSEILCGEDQLFSEAAECNTFECALPCSVSASPPDANFDRGSFKVIFIKFYKNKCFSRLTAKTEN